MGDAIDREEKALRQLTSRLVDSYGHSHSPELVHELVGQVRRRFDGHAVRDFVPILVERIVRRELQHLPPHRGADDAYGPEYAAAHHAPPDRPYPAAEVPAAVSAPAAADGADSAVRIVTVPEDDAHPATAETVVAGAVRTSQAADAEPVAPAVREADSVDPATTENADDTAHFDRQPDLPAARPDDADAAVVAGVGAAVVEPTAPATAPERANPTAPHGESAATSVGAAARPEVTAGGFAAGLRRRPRLVAALAAAVVVVVALVVGFGFRDDDTAPAAAPVPVPATAHGVVGSEKMGFFTDPRVVEALARNGIRLNVEPAGSRQIATTVDLGGYDFAFPSSSLAAERIQRQRGITAKYTPFSSPMTVATFGPIADVLTRSGVLRPGAVPTFDMRRYLELTQQGTQWDRLDGNTGYPVRKNMLLSTTDPRTSNSAAMYLAVAAYVANEDAIVQGPAAENFVLSKVSRLFTKQGYTENSSEGPFAEYLTAGMGPTPMVWGYESQYVEAAVAGKLPANAVLAYPSPTVLSRHTLVPLNATGDRVGRLLSTDPELQRLAAEHGFRTADPAQFAKVTAEHHIPVSPAIVDVVDTPTYDTLEHLLDGVARSYN
ncbi:three-helix bundle dimerization domain-containing protein [Nocardia spumae]|uniref:three-helix bundle dimerization domain-containing protein n=1 Tax=Nocardia spumae TaxID=2887190 RepID=UPI001D133A61|nr:hypothetical protein [Nocardia spumae]